MTFIHTLNSSRSRVIICSLLAFFIAIALVSMNLDSRKVAAFADLIYQQVSSSIRQEVDRRLSDTTDQYSNLDQDKSRL